MGTTPGNKRGPKPNDPGLRELDRATLTQQETSLGLWIRRGCPPETMPGGRGQTGADAETRSEKVYELDARATMESGDSTAVNHGDLDPLATIVTVQGAEMTPPQGPTPGVAPDSDLVQLVLL